MRAGDQFSDSSGDVLSDSEASFTGIPHATRTRTDLLAVVRDV
jgi:hypothetical protein